MLEDSRYKLNPIVSIMRELEFYKKWFPLAITAILILMALLICYVFYVVGGILFISKLNFFLNLHPFIKKFNFIFLIIFAKRETLFIY